LKNKGRKLNEKSVGSSRRRKKQMREEKKRQISPAACDPFHFLPSRPRRFLLSLAMTHALELL